MGSHILVIEDNPANQDLMVYLLKAFGHEPLAASSGEQGLKLIYRKAPDMIICDIQLPGIDGYQVARWLKSHPKLGRIPLIAVTAFAMVGDRDRVLAAGFDGYIAKPITPETFVREIESFVQPASALTRGQLAHISANACVRPLIMAVGPRPRILAVDNSQINLSLAKSILEPLGFNVITSESVQQALATARQAPPDLILSDLHMPGEDGFDFIVAVKADPQLRAIPFVFISSTILVESDRQRALTLGAAGFILRPIEPLALVAEIESCLQRPGGA